MPSTEDPAAVELLRQADAGRYRWPAEVVGFVADVTVDLNGRSFAGRVRVGGPGDVVVEGVADDDAAQMIRSEVGAIANELRHAPFEEREGRHAVTCASTESAHGVEIQVADGASRRIWIREGRIRRLQWSAGHVTVGQVVQDDGDAGDGRGIPQHFLILFQHPQTRELLGVNAYCDRHVLVDGAWLPAARQVHVLKDGDPMRRTLVLSGHQVVRAGG